MDQPVEDRPAAPTHVVAREVAAESSGGYPEPFQSRTGIAHWRRLGDAFGLTRFGFNLETLQPGAQSALRHWHTLNDELVYVLDGEVTLVTDAGETRMTAGMCVGFKAGVRNGHHFINRSDRPADYLLIGSRVPGDRGFYPDDDLMWIETENGRHAAHKDGRPYR
ncbi:MAG TPA: cupin domain-containing protein [Casimicrobiaceae bacterium]|jgi:uncharacterized cupin superfamily protein